MRTNKSLFIALALCLGMSAAAAKGHTNHPQAHSSKHGSKAHGKSTGSGHKKHAKQRTKTKFYKNDGPSNIPLKSLVQRADPTLKFEPIQESKTKPYSVLGLTYYPQTSLLEPYSQEGEASWYGKRFHGKKTATGERYDMHDLTAAHPTLPIPSYARVTNLENGKSVIVRINDRGPFLHGRLIDLSYAAAARIDLASAGSGRVKVEKITPFNRPNTAPEEASLPPAKLPFDDILAAVGINPAKSEDAYLPDKTGEQETQGNAE